MLPESLTLGQRTLEDVFLELTGRELVAVSRDAPQAPSPRAPAPRRCPGMVLAQAAMESRLMLRNGEQLLLAVVIPVIVLRRRRRRRPSTLGLDLAHRAGRRLHPGVLALAVMSTAFTSLAIATGFERRYGVIKRLGSSPLPRSGLLLGKVGALLLVEALQVVGDRRRSALAAGLGPATPPALLGAAARPWCSAPPRSPRSGCSSPASLRAEATLAAANLVYLLLLAGGAVVLPASAYGAARRRRRAGCPPAPWASALRAALIDGRDRLARRSPCCSSGPCSAPSLTARTFTWE